SEVEQNVGWKFNVLPDLPLVCVAWGGCLEGVAADLSAQDFFEDVAEWNVGDVWSVPGAPADVQASQFLWNALDGFVEHVDALAHKATEVFDGRLWVDLVPRFSQVWGVELDGQASIGDGRVRVRQCRAASLKTFGLGLVVLISQTRCRSRGK